VLHCNERDRQTVEAALRETGTDKVSLAPENASFQGGVLLVGPSFDVDLTLDSALTDLRQDMVVELAETLFADVPPMGDAKSALEE
jgi:vacuolar-type H+-ATPase subunit E/Vma4